MNREKYLIRIIESKDKRIKMLEDEVRKTNEEKRYMQSLIDTLSCGIESEQRNIEENERLYLQSIDDLGRLRLKYNILIGKLEEAIDGLIKPLSFEVT